MARLAAPRQGSSRSKIRSALVVIFVGATVLATVNLTHSSTFKEDLRGSSAASHLLEGDSSTISLLNTAPCDSTAQSPPAGGGSVASLAEAGAATAAVDPRDVLNKTTCLERCCWTQRGVEWAYAGEKWRRPTMTDRLSPVDAKSLGDVVYGSLPKPDWFQGRYTPLTQEIVPCLQPGTVIFVENEHVGPFFKTMHDLITVEYILVSGDSDWKSPDGYDQYIDDKKIIHWFGMNCNPHTTSEQLNRYTCIPNGISQWDMSREHMNEAVEKGMGLLHQRLLRPELPRRTDKLFLASFAVATNPEGRIPTQEHFCSKEKPGSLAEYSSCFYDSSPGGIKNHDDYYKGISEHIFTVSPAGAGLDGYRSWEVLYLGGFPIVKKSSIDEAYTGLPVWIVDSWEDVTPERAKFVYELFMKKQWDYSRLYKGYWQRRIFDLRHGRLKAKRIEYSMKK